MSRKKPQNIATEGKMGVNSSMHGAWPEPSELRAIKHIMLSIHFLPHFCSFFPKESQLLNTPPTPISQLHHYPDHYPWFQPINGQYFSKERGDTIIMLPTRRNSFLRNRPAKCWVIPSRDWWFEIVCVCVGGGWKISVQTKLPELNTVILLNVSCYIFTWRCELSVH